MEEVVTLKRKDFVKQISLNGTKYGFYLYFDAYNNTWVSGYRSTNIHMSGGDLFKSYGLSINECLKELKIVEESFCAE